MKILITGASGFIGSFIVEEALKHGMEVWAAVRKSSSKAYLTDARISLRKKHSNNNLPLTLLITLYMPQASRKACTMTTSIG